MAMLCPLVSYQGTNSDSDTEAAARRDAAEAAAHLVESEAEQAEGSPSGQDTREAPILQLACAVCVFGTLLCVMTVVSLSLMVWLVFEYTQYNTATCDIPIQLWVQVVCLTALFNMACNQQDRHGSLGARVFCGWSYDPDNPERVPCRVQLYNLLVPVFTMVWNCVGLYWVSIARSVHPHSHRGHDSIHGDATGASSFLHSGNRLPCKEVAPELVNSVRAYASFNLLYSFFILFSIVGFSQTLYWLARRGLIRVSDAAPPGSLERNTEEVTLSDLAIAEQPQCSICLEDFKDTTDVMVKTKLCGHVFHKEHLANWLSMHRTCPLCRNDLGAMPRSEGP
eukprot:TRINITY_DN16601_c0_g1_i1.p1 TRINITY_DN16601_c0_g1~~TRINITY_DN16601_c0_g1_i1.p1  ORF type:complete len:355 (+),score=29.09 TRINITY_DN16601_c0_g1_i1:53-1066(+)